MFLMNRSSVVWKHDGIPVQQRDHDTSKNGEIKLNKVHVEDSGEFICEVEYVNGKSMSFIHEVSVITVPEILIESKYRYPTEKCDDYTREEFIRRFRSLLSDQICSTFLCSVGDIDVWCEALRERNDKYEFIVKSSLTLKQSPTRRCNPACTMQQIEQTYHRVRSALENDLMENGVIRLLNNDFAYKPKSLAFLEKIYICREGFEKSTEFCLPCKPGTYYSRPKCILCDIDTYNPGYGASRCVYCPEGKENFVLGATSINECAERQPWVTAVTIVIVAGGVLIKLFLCCVISRYCLRRKSVKRKNSEEKSELSKKQLLSPNSSNTENTSDYEFGEGCVSGANSPGPSGCESSIPPTPSPTSSAVSASSPGNASISSDKTVSPPIKRLKRIHRLRTASSPGNTSVSSNETPPRNESMSSNEIPPPPMKCSKRIDHLLSRYESSPDMFIFPVQEQEPEQNNEKWGYTSQENGILKPFPENKYKTWSKRQSGEDEMWFNDSLSPKTGVAGTNGAVKSSFSSNASIQTHMQEYDPEKRTQELQREFQKLPVIPPPPEIKRPSASQFDLQLARLSDEVLKEFRTTAEKKRIGSFEGVSAKRQQMPDFEHSGSDIVVEETKRNGILQNTQQGSIDAAQRLNFAEKIQSKMQDAHRSQVQKSAVKPSKLNIFEKPVTFLRNKSEEMTSQNPRPDFSTREKHRSTENGRRSVASGEEVSVKRSSNASDKISHDKKSSSLIGRTFLKKQKILLKALEGKVLPQKTIGEEPSNREIQKTPLVHALPLTEPKSPHEDIHLKYFPAGIFEPGFSMMEEKTQPPALVPETPGPHPLAGELAPNISPPLQKGKQHSAPVITKDAKKILSGIVWLPPATDSE